LGRRAVANGRSTLAIGREASSTAQYGLAIGDAANVTKNNGLAIGRNATVSHANSIAIGLNAVTTREDQIVIGRAATTVTMPGIATSSARANQGEVIGVLTTDAFGNIAADGGLLAAKMKAMATQVEAATAAMVQFGRTYPLSHVAGQSERLGSNLMSQENAARITANEVQISANTSSIQLNTAAIDANTLAISQNLTRLVSAESRLDELDSGLASVAAMPDMFLNPGEKFAISGGLGAFGDSTAFGTTFATRFDERWSAGLSVAFGDETSAGRLQVRWAR